MRIARTLVALTIGLVWLTSARANITIENPDRIRKTAEDFARAQSARVAPETADLRVTAGRLDSRLRLPACSEEPEAFTAPGQTGIPSSVGVRCPGDSAWTLYVPVRAEVLVDVLVLTMPAERGETLTPAHVRLEQRDVSRLTQTYLTSIDALDGMVMRRRALAGTILSGTVLDHATAVERGERVRLQSGGGALSVNAEGEALADAALGERVRVRNVRSGVVVEGRLAEPGLVVLGR